MIPSFDTHEAIKTLTSGKNFTQKQAETLVGLISKSNKELPTRNDLELMETRMTGRLENLEGKLIGRLDAVEGKMMSLDERTNGRADALESKMDVRFATLQRYVTLQIVGAVVLLAALQYFG